MPSPALVSESGNQDLDESHLLEGLEPLSGLSESASVPMDGIGEENGVLEKASGVQAHTHPAHLVKNLEEKCSSAEFGLCRNEYRAQLEKEYAFQHLTERLLEAEGGYEAIRAEGKALFERFKDHDRYLEADLVEWFLSHVVEGVIERMGRSDRTFQRYIFAPQAPLQEIVARYADELRGNGGAWVNAGRQMEGLWSNLLLLR